MSVDLKKLIDSGFKPTDFVAFADVANLQQQIDDLKQGGSSGDDISTKVWEAEENGDTLPIKVIIPGITDYSQLERKPLFIRLMSNKHSGQAKLQINDLQECVINTHHWALLAYDSWFRSGNIMIVVFDSRAYYGQGYSFMFLNHLEDGAALLEGSGFLPMSSPERQAIDSSVWDMYIRGMLSVLTEGEFIHSLNMFIQSGLLDLLMQKRDEGFFN